MAGFLVLVGIGGPLVLLIQAVYWTAPGPQQARGRRRAAVVGFAFTVVVIGIAVVAGILEGVQATPETDRAEFGVGYTFAFVTFGFPLVAGGLAVCWTAALVSGSTGTRLVRAVALGVGSAIPLFAGLIVLMLQLEDAFHP